MTTRDGAKIRIMGAKAVVEKAAAEISAAVPGFIVTGRPAGAAR